MKVEKAREKDGKLELLVELSVAETEEELQNAAMAVVARNGYGADRADYETPLERVRARMGLVEASFVLDEEIMRRRAPFALSAVRVDTVGAPVYRCSEHAAEGKPFGYQLVCVPVPRFELESYDPVTITVPFEAAKEDEVEAELARMAETVLVPVTDASHDVVSRGDKVELAMETTQDGHRVPALCTEGREYSTGTFAMPDDFDAGVIGMKVGQTKVIGFEGPRLELDEAGKPIMEKFESVVTVKRIVGSKTATMDDEWARTVKPGIESLDDLRADVRERVRQRHEADFMHAAEILAGNELAKRLKGEISDLVYGVALKEARGNLQDSLCNDNLTLDAFLTAQDMTREQLDQALLMQVRSQLTRQLALNAFADHCGLNVFDEDLEAFFEAVAPGKANAAHQDFLRDGRMHAARCAARRLKAARLAVEQAEIIRQGA